MMRIYVVADAAFASPASPQQKARRDAELLA
jgi:hypothetical protein